MQIGFMITGQKSGMCRKEAFLGEFRALALGLMGWEDFLTSERDNILLSFPISSQFYLRTYANALMQDSEIFLDGKVANLV